MFNFHSDLRSTKITYESAHGPFTGICFFAIWLKLCTFHEVMGIKLKLNMHKKSLNKVDSALCWKMWAFTHISFIFFAGLAMM